MSGQGAAQWGAQGASIGTSIMPGWGTLIGGALGAIYGSTLGGNQRPEFTMINKGPGELMAQRAVKDAWVGLAKRYDGSPVAVLPSKEALQSGYGTQDAYNRAATLAGPGTSQAIVAAPSQRLALQDQATKAQGINTSTGNALHSWALAGKMRQAQATRDTINSVNNMRLAYQLQSKALADQNRAETMAAWAKMAGSMGRGLGQMGGGATTLDTTQDPNASQWQLPSGWQNDPTHGMGG